MENKKKKHVGLMVILILFVLAIGLGVYWYFTNIYISKECKEMRSIASNMYNLQDGLITSYTTKTISQTVEDGEESTNVYLEEVDINNKAIKWTSQDRYSSYVEDSTSYMIIENGQECRYEREWSNEDQEYYWYKQIYENEFDGQEATTLQFSALTAVEIISLCNKVELISEDQAGTKVYTVTINKVNLYDMYDNEELLGDAVFEVKIKDGYITGLYSKISNWYKEDDADKMEITIKISNINNTSVNVPTDVLSNLKEKPQGY